MLGQKVTNLVNREMSAGTHNIEWNANDVPSGIYFLKITVENNSITKKTLLVK